MSQLLQLRALTVGAVVAVLSGCGGTDGATAPALCTSPVELAVGTGIQPSLTWEPSCGVTFIVVREAEVGSSQLVWTVSALQGLAPPVRLGVVPPAGQGFSPAPATLTVGRTYTVIVEPSSLDGGLGQLTFIATP